MPLRVYGLRVYGSHEVKNNDIDDDNDNNNHDENCNKLMNNADNINIVMIKTVSFCHIFFQDKNLTFFQIVM